MDNLVITQSSSSPAITADWNSGMISMKGDSYPENSFELFQPLISTRHEAALWWLQIAIFKIAVYALFIRAIGCFVM